MYKFRARETTAFVGDTELYNLLRQHMAFIRTEGYGRRFHAASQVYLFSYFLKVLKYLNQT